MIKANELRIGNWVDYDFVTTELRGYTKITRDLMHDLLEHGTDDIHIINPIPLSPELLEKCGFERDSDDDGDWMNLDLFDGNLQLFYSYKTNSVSVESNPPSVYHLHQLQNLIHALTGSEIEVNL